MIPCVNSFLDTRVSCLHVSYHVPSLADPDCAYSNLSTFFTWSFLLFYLDDRLPLISSCISFRSGISRQYWGPTFAITSGSCASSVLSYSQKNVLVLSPSPTIQRHSLHKWFHDLEHCAKILFIPFGWQPTFRFSQEGHLKYLTYTNTAHRMTLF